MRIGHRYCEDRRIYHVGANAMTILRCNKCGHLEERPKRDVRNDDALPPLRHLHPDLRYGALRQ